MNNFIQLFTIFLATIAAIASGGMALYFWRSTQSIGRAVAIDKAAECTNMLVILAFALFYYFDSLSVMPLAFAALLRMIATCAVLFSSVNLANETWKVERGDDATV